MDGFLPYFKHVDNKFIPWALLAIWCLFLIFFKFFVYQFYYLKMISIVIIILVLLFNLLYVLNALNNQREKNDMPSIKLKSSPQGVVKITGKLKTVKGSGLISPIFGVPCLAYKAEIFKNDQSIFKSSDKTSAIIECHGEVAFIPFYMLEDKALFYFKSLKQIQTNLSEIENILHKLGLNKNEKNPGNIKLVEEVIFEGMNISVLGFFKSLSSTMDYLDGFALINNKPEPIFFYRVNSLEKLKKDWNLFKKQVMRGENQFSNMLHHAFFEYNAKLPIIKEDRTDHISFLKSTLVYTILLWSITIIFLFSISF